MDASTDGGEVSYGWDGANKVVEVDETYVGGKAYEVIDRDGVVEHKLYIGSTLVITDYASTTEHGFLLRDHLGSVDQEAAEGAPATDREPNSVTDLTGAVIERTSFDESVGSRAPGGKWFPLSLSALGGKRRESDKRRGAKRPGSK